MPGEYTFSPGEVVNAAKMTTYWMDAASVTKSVDESVTSSTTNQDDNELVLDVRANTTYWVECFLMYSASAAGDIKTTYSGPSGSTFDWCADSNTSTATATVAPVSRSLQGLGNTPSHGGLEQSGTPLEMCALHKGVLTVGGTAGQLRLRWAQLASSTTPSKVLAGSTLMITRIT